MDTFGQNCWISRVQHIPNNIIREKMDADDILQIDDKVQKEKNDIESTFESNE